MNTDLKYRSRDSDVILPLSQPFISTDGKETHEVLVPKGTHVIIPIISCNKDPLIWGEDAEEWKPERWLSPLPDSVLDTRIPGVYSHL